MTSTLMPLVMVILIMLLAPMLASRIRLWTYLRFYHRLQRDFLRRRVTFVPGQDRDDPPLPGLYNFVEAEGFIAVLSDPDGADRDKALALAVIGAAQGLIKRGQQEQLRDLLAGMQARVEPPALADLLPGAQARLEGAVLID